MIPIIIEIIPLFKNGFNKVYEIELGILMESVANVVIIKGKMNLIIIIVMPTIINEIEKYFKGL